MKDKLVKAKDNKQVFENMKLPEILSIAKRLMKMVNPERADHHDTWMHVGWTLFNICDGCQEGLDMWIEFSKNVIRRKHVDEARCVWEWNKMEKRNITLGCLRFLARNDSPDQYRDWEEEVRNERIAQCLTGGQNNLARQLHDIVGDFFICASIKREAWCSPKHCVSN